MAVYVIKDGAVQVDFLDRGDMTIAVVGSEAARSTVQNLCRGYGRWVPEFRNWIIFKQNSEMVLDEISRLKIETHQ